MSHTDHYRRAPNATDAQDTSAPAATEAAESIDTTARDKATEGLAVAKDKAKEVADKVTARVATAVDETKKAVADPERRHAAQDAVEQEVRRNPWRALAAAFLIGMRLGRFRSRR